jgi:hypothetical protein
MGLAPGLSLQREELNGSHIHSRRKRRRTLGLVTSFMFLISQLRNQ